MNIAIWLRWGSGEVGLQRPNGTAARVASASVVCQFLTLLADEASLQCLATPLLPTGREWQTLEWASALCIGFMAESLVVAIAICDSNLESHITPGSWMSLNVQILLD